MGMNHKIIRSVKQAAVCRHSGCDVNLVIDAQNSSRVVFRVSPPSAAEKAIEDLEAGREYPGRPLLDTLSTLHTEVKSFLYLYRQVAGAGADRTGE